MLPKDDKKKNPNSLFVPQRIEYYERKSISHLCVLLRFQVSIFKKLEKGIAFSVKEEQDFVHPNAITHVPQEGTCGH